MEYMILIYGDERAFGRIGEAQLKAMYAGTGLTRRSSSRPA